MTATVFEIVEKIKPYAVVSARLDNFVIREDENIPAQSIIENPNFSLYCLDDTNRQAIFVETPPEVDLSQAPFYYQAQYEYALRLAAVSYETFHQLASDVNSGDLIMIYSTGRCGSTLISQAFGTADGVLSLSEPDVYTQLHEMRYLDSSRDAEFTQLLKSSTRLLGKGSSTLAVKFRGMCILVGDLLYEAFPGAKNLFLYRNAETWARSMGLESRPIEVRRVPAPDIPLHWRAMTPLSKPFSERYGRAVTPVELTVFAWLSIMDKYLVLRDQGMRFLAVRYEDILAEPKRVLAAIFAHCGLKAASVERAYDVFSKDSQEGTVYSRANRQQRVTIPLGDEDYAQISAVLQQHPIIQTADFIAPGTATFAN